MATPSLLEKSIDFNWEQMNGSKTNLSKMSDIVNEICGFSGQGDSNIGIHKF